MPDPEVLTMGMSDAVKIPEVTWIARGSLDVFGSDVSGSPNLCLGVWGPWFALLIPYVLTPYRAMREECSLMFCSAMAAGCAPSLLCPVWVADVPVPSRVCTAFPFTDFLITGVLCGWFRRIFPFVTNVVTFTYRPFAVVVVAVQ